MVHSTKMAHPQFIKAVYLGNDNIDWSRDVGHLGFCKNLKIASDVPRLFKFVCKKIMQNGETVC